MPLEITKQPITRLFPKVIREEITSGIIFGLILGALFLAYHHVLSPGVMLLILFLELFVLAYTRFNERNPSAFLHFNRVAEGTILVTIPIMTTMYFFTILLEGISDLTLLRAQFCVAYAGFMLLYVLLAGYTIFGIFVAYQLLFYWHPVYMNQYSGFNSPFIITVMAFLFMLMAIGTWTTHLIMIYGALSKKEYYEEKTSVYHKVAFGVLIISVLLGLLLIQSLNLISLDWLVQLPHFSLL